MTRKQERLLGAALATSVIGIVCYVTGVEWRAVWDGVWHIAVVVAAALAFVIGVALIIGPGDSD